MKGYVRSQNTNSILKKSTLVVIDPNIEDFQLLAQSVRENATAFILDPNRDGVEQVTELLSANTNIQSLHLVSHGWSGGLQLGNSQLS